MVLNGIPDRMLAFGGFFYTEVIIPSLDECIVG
jgi:hypothetical protein